MDPSPRNVTDELRVIARRVMRERGLLPDFSKAVRAEASAITGPATEDGGSIRDLREPALVVDRQRRFARSRSAHRRASACRRRDDDLRRRRRRRRAGRGRLGDRRPRPHQHDVGVHGRGSVLDAAREAVDRPHVALRKRRPARRRRRDDGRRRRDDTRVGPLPRQGSQPREARVQRAFARGSRERRPRRRSSPQLPASTRISGCRIASRRR